MANFIITALQLMLPAIVAGILTLFYLPVYKDRINARLEHFGDDNMTTKLKPITTPLKFFLRTLLIAAAAIIIIAMTLSFLFVGVKSTGPTKIAEESDTMPEIWFINQPSPSMLDGYTPGDEIPGYSITEVKKQGDFEFYFYALPEVMYQGFPDGFVGISYTGSGNVSLGIESDFSSRETSEGKVTGGQGYAMLPAPSQWFSLDITNFFGYADFTVFAMTDEENEKYSADLRDKGPDANISITDYTENKETFRLDLSEEYNMTE